MAGEGRLRMRDELGLLRRAGGRIEKDRQIDVRLPRRDPGRTLLERVEPDAWPWCAHITRTYDGQLLQVGHGRPADAPQDRGKIDRAELSLEEHELRARYPQDMRQVGAAIARVDGDDDATEPGGGKQQGHPFQAIDEPDRDHVALADALRGQPGGGLIDPVVELGTRDADAVEAEGGG